MKRTITIRQMMMGFTSGRYLIQADFEKGVVVL